MAMPSPKECVSQPAVVVGGSFMALFCGPTDSSCSLYMLLLHSIELCLLLTSQFHVTSIHVIVNNSDSKLSLF